jgi:hypothetical protein
MDTPPVSREGHCATNVQPAPRRPCGADTRTDGKVKRAITALAIEPVATKGVCNYFGRDAIDRIKEALAKA